MNSEVLLLLDKAETIVRPKPIVKWVGGKKQLISDLVARIPKSFTHYCEPFAGGAALCLYLQPKQAIINDANRELMNVYAVVKHQVEALISALKQHEHTQAHFYKVRQADRAPDYYSRYSDVERAARLLFLNKTCFNGLYRVNRQGEFNTPFGQHKNPDFVNAQGLRAVSHYLNNNTIQLYGVDATDILEVAETLPRTFFYLDPPYTPISQTSSFTGYTASGFSFSDQERLYQFCLRLHAEGHFFLLSNSAHPAVMNLYRDFNIEVVRAKRNINCQTDKRGSVNEVLIRNYDDNNHLLTHSYGGSNAC